MNGAVGVIYLHEKWEAKEPEKIFQITRVDRGRGWIAYIFCV